MSVPFAIAAVLGMAAVVFLWVGAPHVQRRFEQSSLARYVSKNRILSLTFDDGPCSRLTPALLEVLENRGARVTFFLLGRRVCENSQAVDRILACGHEIGAHSHDHRHAWRSSPWRVREDTHRGFDALEQWLGDRPLYRPPYGKTTIGGRVALKRHSARIGWWTIDSGDTHRVLPTPGGVVEGVRRAGGGVVLMHDFDREGPDREKRAAFVLRTTELLLEMAQREGLRVCTLGEVLDSMDRERAARTPA